MLEVLVGKTLEQSLVEVLAEEELADLRQQQRMFEELRNAELAEQQRLEEQDRRLVEEKVTVLSVFCFNGFNQTAIVLRYSARMKPRKTIKPLNQKRLRINTI